MVTAYDYFENAEAVDISLVVSGPANATVVTDLISMAETRKDCLVFVSPEKADVVDNAGSEVTDIKAYRETLTSTSYAVLDGNWKYQYDKYNDVYRWVPLNGDIAGLCANRRILSNPMAICSRWRENDSRGRNGSNKQYRIT